jgi:hypothetical protein
MLNETLTTLALLLAAPAVAAAPVPSTANCRQEPEEEKPDKRPEVAELLDKLKDHVDERGKEDPLAVELIDTLVQEFPNCGPKDRGSIVKAFDKHFSAKRKDTDEGMPNNALYLATAVALGTMAPESTKVLTEWIDHKAHRRDMALQRQLILSLGKTHDEDAIETLIGLLPHKEATMQSAAAEALGEFTFVEEDQRKDIFESVLKVLGSAKNAVDGDVNDTIARERYDAISASMITTLQRISGHDERDPAAWQRWWNKNKKEDWEAVGDQG